MSESVSVPVEKSETFLEAGSYSFLVRQMTTAILTCFYRMVCLGLKILVTDLQHCFSP